MKIITPSMLKTLAIVMGSLAVVNNVGALKPVKNAIGLGGKGLL